MAEKQPTPIGQKGFSVLVGILVLFIIATAGSTGYYVWRSNSQSHQALNNALETSKNAPSPLRDPAHAKHPFAIYQWGVKGFYVGSLTLKYVIINSGHHKAYFSSAQLTASAPACSIENGAGGYIDRYAVGERFTLPSGQAVTIEQFVQSGRAAAYSRTGKYYYVASQNSAACAESQESKKLQAETFADVKSITKSFTAYCSVLVCG